MTPHVRVESKGYGADFRVWYVDAAGAETEISRAVSAVDVHLDAAAGAHTATLQVLTADNRLVAEIDEVIAEEILAARSAS